MTKEDILKALKDSSVSYRSGKTHFSGINEGNFDVVANKILALQPTDKEIGCQCQYECGVVDWKRWHDGAMWVKNFKR